MHDFYEPTMERLNLLINNPNPTEVFYKSIIG